MVESDGSVMGIVAIQDDSSSHSATKFQMYLKCKGQFNDTFNLRLHALNPEILKMCSEVLGNDPAIVYAVLGAVVLLQPMQTQFNGKHEAVAIVEIEAA